MEDSNSQQNSEQSKEEPKIDDVLKKMESANDVPESEKKDAPQDAQLEKLKGVLSEADAQAQEKEKTQDTSPKTQEEKEETSLRGEEFKEEAREESKDEAPPKEKKDFEFSENVQKLDQIIRNYKNKG